MDEKKEKYKLKKKKKERKKEKWKWKESAKRKENNTLNVIITSEGFVHFFPCLLLSDVTTVLLISLK